jgi:hypothetical protein
VSDSSEEERTNRNSDRFRRLTKNNPVVTVLERRELPWRSTQALFVWALAASRRGSLARPKG